MGQEGIFYRINAFLKRINRKFRRELYEHGQKSSFDFDQNHIVNNIFDYNYIIRDRKPRDKEIYDGNLMYGLGGILRKYANYSGKIYCAVEHGVPTEREDNVIEYRDNDMPVILAHSDQRRDFLKSRTNKLMFTIGPNFMPYAKGICTDFAVSSIKKNLGRTLLVYPQHNNDRSEFIEFIQNRDKLIKYIKHIKEVGQFSTVLICLYYIDIERGMQFFYEQEGWIVVSAGKNTNYDFPDCFKTILKISDYVIAQSITGIAYSMYENIPCTFYPGERKMIRENGEIDEDAWTINGKSWIEKTEQTLCNLFGDYSESITESQKQWCEFVWGYQCIKTPDELKLILEFSRDIRRKYTDLAYVKKVSLKAKYAPIRKYVEEAVEIAKKEA